jgi:hypothetical protein
MQINNKIALEEIFKHFHSAGLTPSEKKEIIDEIEASASNVDNIQQSVYNGILKSVINRVLKFNGDNVSEFKGLVVNDDTNSIHEYLQAALDFLDCDKSVAKAFQEIQNMTSQKLKQTYKEINTTQAIREFILDKCIYPITNSKCPEGVQEFTGDQEIEDCIKEITQYIEKTYIDRIANILQKQIIQELNNSKLIKTKKDKKPFTELVTLLEQDQEIKVIKTLYSLKYHAKLKVDPNTVSVSHQEFNDAVKTLLSNFQQSLDKKIDLSTILNQLISAEKQRSLAAQMETLTINSEKQQSKQEEEKKQESLTESIQTQQPQEQFFGKQAKNKKKQKIKISKQTERMLNIRSNLIVNQHQR